MNWEIGDAPEGWTLKPLGEITKVVGGGTPKTAIKENFSDSEGHPWITPADLSGFDDKFVRKGRRYLTDRGLATSSAKLLPAGTVLFSSRAPIGYVAIAEIPVATNQGFRSFLPSDELHPEYLYYALKYLRPLAEQMASGTTFTEISGSTAAQLPIAYPDRRAQAAIVEVLDISFSKRSGALKHLKATRHAVERFRQSVLAAACSGRLTADWRDSSGRGSANALIVDLRQRHKEAKVVERQPKVVEASVMQFDATAIPDSWAVAPLKILCEPGRPITYGILKPGPHIDEGVPYVRVTDFKSGAIKLDALKKTSAQIAHDYRRSILRAGDLLFAIRGTFGHVALVTHALEGANITQDSARLGIDSTISRDYVQLALRSPSAQLRVSQAAKGVAVRGINLGDLRELLLPIPPRDEQEEIVHRVNQLLTLTDALRSRTATAARRVERTSQAVLAKAFRGEFNFVGLED